MEMFYVDTAQQGGRVMWLPSTWNVGSKWIFLFYAILSHLNLNSCVWLLATFLDSKEDI